MSDLHEDHIIEPIYRDSYRDGSPQDIPAILRLIETMFAVNVSVCGFIDFVEFIAVVNLVVQGKMKQKFKWYFKLYDADGNGSIDQKGATKHILVQEVLRATKTLDGLYSNRHGLRIKAVQTLNGQQTLSPKEFANLMFPKIDTNNDGKASLALLWLTFPYKVGNGGGGEGHLGKSVNHSRKP
ncbi:hypothetical protein MC885_013405 [Smutsia gigantea]|nr:hypothetical protein MC885_013405 [Smutsia gigantea]